MNCDELEPLQGPYLDSELDPRTTLAVQQHLAACLSCARAFAEQARLDARLAAGLKQGERTSTLWQPLERAVLDAAQAAPSPRSCIRHPELRQFREFSSTLARQFLAGLRPGPRAWAGLAAAWAVILTLHFAARGSLAPPVAGPETPSNFEMRSALAQKQLLMTELAPPPEARPKAGSPGPRTDRHHQTLNT